MSPLTDKSSRRGQSWATALMAVPSSMPTTGCDEAIDIAEEEATEDAERQKCQVGPLSSAPTCGRRRGCYGWQIVWLWYCRRPTPAASCERSPGDEMEAVIALAFFIPLLIGTGGAPAPRSPPPGPRDGLPVGPMCLRC